MVAVKVKVKVFTRAAGRLNWKPGDIVTIGADDAMRLVNSGLAEVIAQDSETESEPIESELTEEPEQAEPIKRGRGRPRKA